MRRRPPFRPPPAPRALLAAAVVALAASACAGTTPIGELMDDPFRHDGETVRVEGEVTESVGFLGPGVYRLRDDTGTLPVVSRGGGAPESGARVRVEGTFRAAFTLGSESLAVLEEDERSSP
jgi:hypothetical protein